MAAVSALSVSVAAFPSGVFAGVGTTAAQFLKLSPTARGAAMADAQGASADDVFAIYSNPAGLAAMEKAQLGASYITYFTDVNYGFVGYADPDKSIGAVGIGLTYLVINKIERYSINEVKGDDFTAGDMALSFAWARRDAIPAVLENTSVGAALRLISSEMDQTAGYTASVDIGAIHRPVSDVAVAIAVQNISPGLKFREVTDNLPLNIKVAGAYDVTEDARLGLEINQYIIDAKSYAAVGGEYWLSGRRLALRLGYKYGYDTASLGSLVGITGGLGFRVWGAGLDYAFVPFGDLGDTHRVTFSAKF